MIVSSILVGFAFSQTNIDLLIEEQLQTQNEAAQNLDIIEIPAEREQVQQEVEVVEAGDATVSNVAKTPKRARAAQKQKARKSAPPSIASSTETKTKTVQVEESQPQQEESKTALETAHVETESGDDNKHRPLYLGLMILGVAAYLFSRFCHP